MKWEYKTERLTGVPIFGFQFDENEFENHINELGQQEWEIASTFSIDRSGYTKEVIVLFKRPKQ